jgi:hypothetical protein
MATQASRWLDLLDDGRRRQAVFGFPDDRERTRWFYTPGDHGGLALAECTPAQRRAGLRLLATGLSPAGYHLAAAMLAPQAPPDIVTGNRPVLEEGLWVARPRELFPDADKIPHALLDALQVRLATDEKALGPAVIRSLSWTREPAGVSWPHLRPGQREILTALPGAYLGRLPDAAAEAEHAKITGAAARQLHFAWAGSMEPHRPHYCRIQGPRLLAEYDNTQRSANHVHTVWRDPDGDFGRDILAAHYLTSH